MFTCEKIKIYKKCIFYIPNTLFLEYRFIKYDKMFLKLSVSLNFIKKAI